MSFYYRRLVKVEILVLLASPAAWNVPSALRYCQEARDSNENKNIICRIGTDRYLFFFKE